MTPDLMYLVWSAALTVAMVLVAVFAAMMQVGLPALAGNRDDMPPLTGFAGRAERLHLNMLQNLPLFAILVLAAAVTNRADGVTALGASLFFWARVVHGVFYLIGVPWLRTMAWCVSIVGLVLIFVRLI
ncbi:MAPEG family protein [Methylovirgula sp. 4M-Z18]|uniref:MAPEG family protein n=1 Tax=Methylovirgula sp. 4M-Z18 TaxID=2293567 RepID=UPI001314098E|nr:MAPEG family protein [Methylovirgula sp. 4M-Z18]